MVLFITESTAASTKYNRLAFRIGLLTYSYRLIIY